ncbi:MAG: acyl-CoA dehydrogenase [SAR202 cluster bacterium]|uniref:Butyryl-CoA dehydrogenase n=1 Tax=hydrothermal vent metagenome TaxID=652676 RepID=A0A170QAC7_9ZZZZ|nr:acyl-CoA dehydrogenase family protein [Dehalococcoidia bacterium]MEC9289243.1 acyl-CoA dehydrogenase family protein [Chloroflexota bacterium]MQF91129.1 acyl-CoA dehydrogenase [SAR202 cluster bacterium]MCH2498830.1 acyl-CoA dehydrogenase family protein [Dehalococcoidia bacterium]MCH2502797.1 acyl-CoA dehydrogenase family protein [Dehalococcoidia bacterium]
MEFKFTAEDEEFRTELRAFMKTELPDPWEGAGRYPEDDDWDLNRVIRQKMAEKGWLTMHWPEEYGGQNASPVKSAIYNEEIAYMRAPGRDIFGVRMLGPTLMIHGSEEQKKTHLPSVAKGEIQWCQGYSEPESGSDLASLSTRAVRDGDELVINGAKVWTTMAHRADWIMLLTRTDPDAPKHRGISFVLVDMKSPGVSVRPIINMAGGHEFNQVTFDDVRVPRANVVGDEDRGWYVAVTLLDFERSGIDYSASARRLLDDTKEFATETKRNGVPLIEIPWVRTLMADRYIDCEVARLMAYNVAYMQSQDLIPTKEASMSKVFGSEVVQRVTEAALDILGMYGTLGREDKWAPLNGRVQENWMNAFAGTIAAGTSEIQRNIIAGRGLGLPRG